MTRARRALGLPWICRSVSVMIFPSGGQEFTFVWNMVKILLEHCAWGIGWVILWDDAPNNQILCNSWVPSSFRQNKKAHAHLFQWDSCETSGSIANSCEGHSKLWSVHLEFSTSTHFARNNNLQSVTRTWYSPIFEILNLHCPSETQSTTIRIQQNIMSIYVKDFMKKSSRIGWKVQLPKHALCPFAESSLAPLGHLPLGDEPPTIGGVDIFGMTPRSVPGSGSWRSVVPHLLAMPFSAAYIFLSLCLSVYLVVLSIFLSYVHMYVYIYIYMHIYMYVYIHIYIYIYT